MKRGKNDEKMVGPMFPRLHVNDTEKGGPRAPPRNKMALYEQFSIPSQRSISKVSRNLHRCSSVLNSPSFVNEKIKEHRIQYLISFDFDLHA